LEFKEELKARWNAVRLSLYASSPEVRQLLEGLSRPDTGIWSRIIKTQVSPLYSIVSNKIEEAIRRRQKTILFVVHDNRQRAATSNLLNTADSSVEILVKKTNELRDHPKVDRLIYIGSLKTISRLDEEFLLRAPITDEIDIIEVGHSGGIQKAGLYTFALDPDVRFPINRAPAIGTIERVHSPNTTQVEDEEFESEYSDSYSVRSEELDTLRSVDAFRAILGGGYGSNLGIEGDVFVAHCRMEGYTLICHRIEKKDVIDLDPGDLLVLTTEGSGDMIAPYADKHMGSRAATYRDLQKAWKNELAGMIREIGITQTIEELKSESGFDISPTNLRQWVGHTVHGPGKDRESVFEALLRMLKRGDRIPIHKEALDRIREASFHAGHHLQSELRKNLVGKDMTQVLADGFMEFRLDANGPAKTIFELQRLDSVARPVSSHHINRVFKLKHGGASA
jgi:hypothetical protein